MKMIRVALIINLVALLVCALSSCQSQKQFMKKGYEKGWIDTITKKGGTKLDLDTGKAKNHINDVINDASDKTNNDVDSDSTIPEPCKPIIKTVIEKERIYLQSKTPELVQKLASDFIKDTTITFEGTTVHRYLEGDKEVFTFAVRKMTIEPEKSSWMDYWWLLLIGASTTLLLCLFLYSKSGRVLQR